MGNRMADGESLSYIKLGIVVTSRLAAHDDDGDLGGLGMVKGLH